MMRNNAICALLAGAMLIPSVGAAQDSAVILAAPETPADPNALPRGAPADDYEFVGWCVGVLATHMDLYIRVKPELDAISRRWDTAEEDAVIYAQQQQAGRQILSEFQSAMRAAEGASAQNLALRGERAIQSGVAMWGGLNQVDMRNQAYSWMNWELPSRCINVAESLENRSTLASAVLRDNSGAAAALNAPQSGTATGAAFDFNAPPEPDAESSAEAIGGRLR